MRLAPMKRSSAPALHAMRHEQISEREFHAIRAWIREAAGINLSEQKKALIVGRLAARLRHYGLESYGQYFNLLQSGARRGAPDRKSTRLNSSHTVISYAVFCLKK